MTLDEAIADSVNKNFREGQQPEDEKAEKKPEEKKPEEKKPEEKKPEEKSEKTIEDDSLEIDATEEEIANGLALIRALGNPEERMNLLKILAKEGNYDLNKKSEQKQLVRDAKVVLKEKLGDAYDILGGDSLAEAIEELTDNKVKTLTKPIEDQIKTHEDRAKEEESRRNQEAANTAMDNFFTRHKITAADQREAIAADMMKKMSAMPASKGADINVYLDDIYSLTEKGRSEARAVKSNMERINQNAKERNSSGGGTDNDERIKPGSRKNVSLDEAVRAAMQGRKLED